MTQPTRRAALALLQENRNTLSELESEMDQYGLADPVLLERKRRAVILAREAALRWTGKAVLWPIKFAGLTHCF